MLIFIFGVKVIGYFVKIFIINELIVVVNVVVMNIVFGFIFVFVGNFLIFLSDSVVGLINSM